jgi:hypothetical protein
VNQNDSFLGRKADQAIVGFASQLARAKDRRSQSIALVVQTRLDAGRPALRYRIQRSYGNAQDHPSATQPQVPSVVFENLTNRWGGTVLITIGKKLPIEKAPQPAFRPDPYRAVPIRMKCEHDLNWATFDMGKDFDFSIENTVETVAGPHPKGSFRVIADA